MKKVLCLCLALVMVLGFASCGKKPAGNDEIPTLTWYMPGDKQADIASVMEKANEITVKEIGAKIDLQFIDQSAYGEKMKMMMASQTPMDIVFVGYALNTHSAVELGGLLDITDMLPEVTPKLYNELIPEYVWKAASDNGRNYSVPNIQILCQYSTLYFRKDLLEKYGYDKQDLITPEALEGYLQKIKDNEPDIIPMRAMFNWPELTIEGTTGVVFVTKEDHKVVDKMTYGDMLNMYKLRNKWYKKGFFRQDIDTNSDDAALYKAGKFAVMVAGWKPGAEGEFKEQLGVDYVKADMTTPYMHTNTVIATQNAISKTSKNPELALKFIELINGNVELYNLICYGVEGKHYNKTGESRVELIPDSGYTPNASWKFGNETKAYLLPAQEDGVKEATVKANEESIKSPLLGLIYDTKAVQTEIIQCENAASQYNILYATENVEEAFDLLVQKRKEAGVDRIIEVYQKQVDEYIKNNK